MQQSIFPHEILLNVLYHLDGDHKTISSLTRTCHLLRDLLTENEARIVAAIAHKQRAGPIRYLLETTAIASKPPTFAWLHDAYARGHAIECLTNALENVGVYKNQAIFGTPFSVHGRRLVEADYADVRRYIMTSLLAVELHSWSWRMRKSAHSSDRAEPEWAAGLAMLSQELVGHLALHLHLCVKSTHRDNDIVMTGTPEAVECALPPPERTPQPWADFLFHGMLFTGARGIVDLLSSTYDNYGAFETVAKYRFCADFLKPNVFQTILPQSSLLWSPKLDRLLFHKGRDERDQARRSRSPGSFKDYVFNNDIDEWKKDVPDDEAWTRFMHENGWSKALGFDSVQLRKKEPRPIFKPVLVKKDNMFWGVSEFLRDPVLVR